MVFSLCLVFRLLQFWGVGVLGCWGVVVSGFLGFWCVVFFGFGVLGSRAGFGILQAWKGWPGGRRGAGRHLELGRSAPFDRTGSIVRGGVRTALVKPTKGQATRRSHLITRNPRMSVGSYQRNHSPFFSWLKHHLIGPFKVSFPWWR